MKKLLTVFTLLLSVTAYADYEQPVSVTSARASSNLPASVERSTGQYNNYESWSACDGNYTTAWVEGVRGQGEGQWIELYFAETELNAIYIQNGYWKTPERLAQNSRLQRILVEFADGGAEEFVLPDPVRENYWEMITTPGTRLDLLRPHRTNFVRIRILATYRGSRWTDTCVSEIIPLGIVRE
ncbi:MAG: hypothetical protein LBQ96_03820 [Fusobacteriaceae bacterium]|jgi:hypothetical protein|nr:hypothetical protein [Fusobacteriaceae bacterium]